MDEQNSRAQLTQSLTQPACSASVVICFVLQAINSADRSQLQFLLAAAATSAVPVTRDLRAVGLNWNSLALAQGSNSTVHIPQRHTVKNQEHTKYTGYSLLGKKRRREVSIKDPHLRV